MTSFTRRKSQSGQPVKVQPALFTERPHLALIVEVREVACDQRGFQLRMTVEEVIGAPAEFDSSIELRPRPRVEPAIHDHSRGSAECPLLLLYEVRARWCRAGARALGGRAIGGTPRNSTSRRRT